MPSLSAASKAELHSPSASIAYTLAGAATRLPLHPFPAQRRARANALLDSSVAAQVSAHSLVDWQAAARAQQLARSQAAAQALPAQRSLAISKSFCPPKRF